VTQLHRKFLDLKPLVLLVPVACLMYSAAQESVHMVAHIVNLRRRTRLHHDGCSKEV